MARGNFTRRKSNTYELFDTYGICHMSYGKSFLFDIEDFPHVQEHYWVATTSGYAAHFYYERNENNKRVRRLLFFHRLIMGEPKGMDVDHINGDTLNNRKSNLRVCTSHNNDCNRAAPKNNTSGHIGVSYSKHHKGWRAYITIYGKQIQLGVFDDIKEAVEARRLAEKQYFGEFSRMNYESEVMA